MPYNSCAMEAEDALTTTENVLRDLIEDVLRNKYGAEWIAQRVDEETRERWQDRLTEEKGRRAGVKVDDRLIYYSDLSDLPNLLKNEWEAFKACFGNWKTTELYLKRLIGFRHAKHHGRDLLPFERDLLAGMTGEIRNKVTVFQSERGPDEEYFPKVEYVTDSFGHVARGAGASVHTGLTLHPGDEVRFTCHGWDPKGERLQWAWNADPDTGRTDNFEDDEFTWQLEDGDVAENQCLHIFLLSFRPFHRHGWYDDSVTFRYHVLPRSI